MPFRDAGFLDPRELLIAQAIHAQAWAVLAHDPAVAGADQNVARARLAAIVMHLMANRDRSIGDLSAAAVTAFKIG